MINNFFETNENEHISPEQTGDTPPIKPRYSKVSYEEYPYGREWHFFWQRFLRVQ